MQASFEQLPVAKLCAIVKAGIEEFSAHTYADANTDHITANSGISKGLLYHYFGTKKKFYLYCLKYALDILTKTDMSLPVGDFYEILFTSMEQKMRQCAEYSAETKLLNMAAREFSREVKVEKDAIFGQYVAQIQSRSEHVISAAVATLKLQTADEQLAINGLKLYTNALVNRYLLQYQNTPEIFFSHRDTIAQELKSHIDLMLYGICKEEK